MAETNSWIRSEVERIFREVFEEPSFPLHDSTSRASLPEWDSVMQVKLVLAMEEAFAIEFMTDEVASVDTIGAFVTVIESRRG